MYQEIVKIDDEELKNTEKFCFVYFAGVIYNKKMLFNSF